MASAKALERPHEDDGYDLSRPRSQCSKYVGCMKLGSGQKAVGQLVSMRSNATV